MSDVLWGPRRILEFRGTRRGLRRCGTEALRPGFEGGLYVGLRPSRGPNAVSSQDRPVEDCGVIGGRGLFEKFRLCIGRYQGPSLQVGTGLQDHTHASGAVEAEPHMASRGNRDIRQPERGQGWKDEDFPLHRGCRLELGIPCLFSPKDHGARPGERQEISSHRRRTGDDPVGDGKPGGHDGIEGDRGLAQASRRFGCEGEVLGQAEF